MSDRRHLTVRGKRLAIELRKLREATGMTLSEVTARMDWHPTKLSKIENSKLRINHGDVADLLDLYGVTDQEERAILIDFARQARKRGWWQAYGSVLPIWFQGYVGLEGEAERLRVYESTLVHGLLQTEAYARALTVNDQPELSPEEVDRLVELRLQRQKILTADKAPEVWEVMSETALRLHVGSREVRRGQLEQLLALSELPNLNLLVLPFDAKAHSRVQSSFTVLEFPRRKESSLVYLEYPTGSLFLEEEPEVDRYRLFFDKLQGDALGRDASTKLIASVLKEA